jgi:hypothetical protein
MKKRRIIINNDYYNIFQLEPPVRDQDIHNAVDRVAGTQVDALFMMIPSTLGNLKAGVSAEVARLYDHPEADTCLANLEAFLKKGKDPFQMLLQRARSKKMEFFASVRMNDTHYLDHLFHPWVPQFYYDHLHQRVGEGGSRGGAEFDYRFSSIREHMLGIIREAVDRYDVDGIELDCTRNCMFFPRGNAASGTTAECAPVFTEFVRQVREHLDKIGKKRKRRISLCVTIPCSLLKARQEGLDIPTWARMGLIDMLCLSSPFEADFDRDVHDIRLKVPGIQVYGGCDRNFQYPGRVVPMEAYRAMAMNYLRQGADGIYLYNVMAWTQDLDRLNLASRRDGGQGPGASDIGLVREVGEIRTLEPLDKLYLMSNGMESADKPYASLPVTVPAGGDVTLRMTVGDDIAGAAAANRLQSIRLQTVSTDCVDYNNYTVKLNAVDLSRQYAFVPFAEKPTKSLLFPEPNRTSPPPAPEKIRRHPVRPIDLHMGVNFITIQSYRDPLTISDVELAIEYRK